jgi:AcrR family transcriptional regulator
MVTDAWREARRRSARDVILEAAWELVRRDGLASLSLRDLARQAGITTPTIYAYFESKNAIYDGMFGQAAARFAARMDEPYRAEDPRGVLAEGLHRFVQFCTSDVARYQLLFQRTIPGFEPTGSSFTAAVRALAVVREQLARNGVTDPRHVDLWTALTTGLVDQQISNDPGGERWSGLVDEAVDMFLAHSRPGRPPRPPRPPRPIRP